MSLPCFLGLLQTYGIFCRRLGTKEATVCFSKAKLGSRKTLAFARFQEAIRQVANVLEETYLDLVRRMARRLPQAAQLSGPGGGYRRDAGLERSIVEKRDPKTGHAYFVNELTGKTAWRREELLLAQAAAIPVITQDLRLQVRRLTRDWLTSTFSRAFFY
jgi:hypothetical protein